jgi:hypothetical protein
LKDAAPCLSALGSGLLAINTENKNHLFGIHSPINYLAKEEKKI